MAKLAQSSVEDSLLRKQHKKTQKGSEGRQEYEFPSNKAWAVKKDSQHMAIDEATAALIGEDFDIEMYDLDNKTMDDTDLNARLSEYSEKHRSSPSFSWIYDGLDMDMDVDKTAESDLYLKLLGITTGPQASMEDARAIANNESSESGLIQQSTERLDSKGKRRKNSKGLAINVPMANTEDPEISTDPKPVKGKNKRISLEAAHVSNSKEASNVDQNSDENLPNESIQNLRAMKNVPGGQASKTTMHDFQGRGGSEAIAEATMAHASSTQKLHEAQTKKSFYQASVAEEADEVMGMLPVVATGGKGTFRMDKYYSDETLRHNAAFDMGNLRPNTPPTDGSIIQDRSPTQPPQKIRSSRMAKLEENVRAENPQVLPKDIEKLVAEAIEHERHQVREQ
jgi:hypothetical protein